MDMCTYSKEGNDMDLDLDIQGSKMEKTLFL